MNKNQLKAKLLVSTAATLFLLAPAMAQAQDQAKPQPQGAASATAVNQIEEVVVTGTSIRGTAPVGSNLISMTRTDIDLTADQSMRQILQSVPALSGLTAAAQGRFSGATDATSAVGPSIHGLGGNSSNSTLVLIDGHRFPLQGTGGNNADPTFLPSNALERVEVLPDGASSIYGSDAVAGVVNFITRRRFDGVEITGQRGFGDNYSTYDAGLVAGKTWSGGFAYLAFEDSYRSAIAQADRPYTSPNHIPQGGTNSNSAFCGPASVQPTGSSLIYLSPYTAGIPSAQSSAPCNTVAYTDLIPADNRRSLMVKAEQEINDRLTVSGDAVYAYKTVRQNISDGTLTALIYGPGSGKGGQINPFYVAPAGSTAASETVRLGLDNLLGQRAYTLGTVETYYATGKAEYKLADDWRVSGMFLLGANTSTATNYNTACISCATLALNGTTNSNANTTQPSIAGTNVVVLNPTLTAANALDPFNLGNANRTSPAVLASLVDGPNYLSKRQTIQQYDVKLDGRLARLPAGDFKIAAGGEYLNYTDSPSYVTSLNIGPISQGAATVDQTYQRSVASGFVEGLAPLISPDMRVPLVDKFDIDVSGRYDHYSDFGSTFNPKFGATWQVVTGFKIRGDIASSFVAPPLNAISGNGQNTVGTFLGPFSVPLSAYPQARLIPACASATTACTFNVTAVQGLVLQGQNQALKAQTGKTWSVGGDFASPVLPGLNASITYWHNDYIGGVTSPIPALALGTPAWGSLLTIYPNGATTAQLAALSAGRRQSTQIPQTVYWSYNFAQQNALNLTVEGIDGNVQYGHGFDWGRVTGGVAFSYLTRFDQQLGAGSPTFSVLNVSGYNSTFASIQFQARANLGLQVGPASLTAFVNHTGGFTYWGTPINPVVTNAAGVPIGGGDKIKAYNTVDLHAAYDLGSIAPKPLQKLRVFVDVTNLFDAKPPFENTSSGYDNFAGNPIGRVVTLGLSAKF